MNTDLTSTQIAQLTAVVTGGGYKRAATKEAAAKRFIASAKEKGLADPESLLDESFEDAREILNRSLGSIAVGKEIAKAKEAPAKADKAEAKKNAEAMKAAAKAIREKTAQRNAKAKAEKKAKAPKADKGPTKRDIMLDMVCAKSGATEQEICDAIGWKACLVTLKRAAAAAGVTLSTEKVKGEKTRYFGKR